MMIEVTGIVFDPAFRAQPLLVADGGELSPCCRQQPISGTLRDARAVQKE